MKKSAWMRKPGNGRYYYGLYEKGRKTDKLLGVFLSRKSASKALRAVDAPKRRQLFIEGSYVFF